MEFSSLDLLYMMRTKLRHCSTRTLKRDLEDIKYMLDTYVSEIPVIRNRLDKNDLNFFLGTNRVKEMAPAVQARYRTLVGC